jgi:alpha-amylase/alpha-mannosidase (GH57 family)
MTHAVTLLLGVHAHQPVGNFPEVIEDAHLRCYKPFLETLYAYPDFRFAAHFSGWLLDWLRERYPADMDLLAEMVKRGQVELFSSGDTEPVLAAIPHRDRVGQLRTLNDKLTAWTG